MKCRDILNGLVAVLLLACGLVNAQPAEELIPEEPEIAAPGAPITPPPVVSDAWRAVSQGSVYFNVYDGYRALFVGNSQKRASVLISGDLRTYGSTFVTARASADTVVGRRAVFTKHVITNDVHGTDPKKTLSLSANIWSGLGAGIDLNGDAAEYAGELNLVAGYGNGRGKGIRFCNYTGPQTRTWKLNMRINNDGTVGIGTEDTKGYRLGVAGGVIAESVVVKLRSDWPDYVLDGRSAPPSLDDVRRHIEQWGRLPGVPSAAQVKRKGISLGEMDATLLKKVEELTLYVLELKDENRVLRTGLEALEARVRK